MTTETNILPPYLHNSELAIKKFIYSNGWQIGKSLGKGAQGTVYALINSRVAKITHVLKITPPLVWSDFHFQPERGSHLVERVNHPNICSPTHYFYLTRTNQLQSTPDARSFCLATIMPYVNGATLAKATPTLLQNAESIFSVGRQLADAIGELRNHQVEHTDLNAENILIKEENKPVIIDFDLAVDPTKPHERCFPKDQTALQEHLYWLIKNSSDINPGAKKFLLSCFAKVAPSPSWKEVVHKWIRKQKNTLPKPDPILLTKTFMQACLEHLSEIQPTSRL